MLGETREINFQEPCSDQTEMHKIDLWLHD